MSAINQKRDFTDIYTIHLINFPYSKKGQSDVEYSNMAAFNAIGFVNEILIDQSNHVIFPEFI